MIRNFFFITFFIFLTSTNQALADCTNVPNGKELIEKADIVFEGIAVKTRRNFMPLKPNHYTRFEITEKYKGDIKDSIDIFYSYHRASRPTIMPVETDISYFVFSRKHVNGYYSFEPCFTNFIRTDIERPNEPTIETFSALAEYPSFKHKNIIDKVNQYQTYGERRKAVIEKLTDPRSSED